MKKILSPFVVLCLLGLLVLPTIACAPAEEEPAAEETMEEQGEAMDESMDEMGEDMEEMGEDAEEGMEEMGEEMEEEMEEEGMMDEGADDGMAAEEGEEM